MVPLCIFVATNPSMCVVIIIFFFTYEHIRFTYNRKFLILQYFNLYFTFLQEGAFQNTKMAIVNYLKKNILPINKGGFWFYERATFEVFHTPLPNMTFKEVMVLVYCAV